MDTQPSRTWWHLSDTRLGSGRLMLLAGALSAFVPACTFVIGDRPGTEKRDAQPDADDGPEEDADVTIDAGVDGEVEAGATDAGELDAGDASGNSPDASDATDGADAPLDAMVVADASDANGDTGGAEDTSAPIPDATPPDCDAGPVTWYPDGDNDGYGRSGESVVTCPKPATGNWSTVGGDCRDGDAKVHPNQKEFFLKPYEISQTQDSFDYDCSGKEEGNPSQAVAPDSCAGLLDTLLCTAGKGYEKRPERTGDNLNPLCGSRAYSKCTGGGLLACTKGTTTVEDAAAYACH